MKTINIKGKEYVPVKERLKHFRTSQNYVGWSIVESVIGINDNEGIFKVSIVDENGVEKASAHSQEYRESSYINKTSFVENGFTSALGRALGYLGIGIDAEICSADEVSSAIQLQERIKANENKPQQKPLLTEEQFQKTLEGTPHQAKKVFENFAVTQEQHDAIVNKFKPKS